MSLVALVVALAFADTSVPTANPPLAPSAAQVATARLGQGTVALVALGPGPGRLADELRRELEVSQFSVLSVPPLNAEPHARDIATRLLGGTRDGAGPNVLAVLAAGDGQVTIYTRAGAELASDELAASEPSRPARRRLCLLVVERLRQLGGPESDNPGSAPAADPRLPGGPPVPSPRPPPIRDEPLPPPAPLAHEHGWNFGAASDLDVLSARGTPTAHVALLAERTWRGPFALTARGSWPVLGVSFADGDRSVRAWTFGAQAGANVLLARRTAALRPTLGVALGIRALLTDTDAFELRTSSTAITPALSYGASAGLRYRVRRLVDLVLETELSRGILLLRDRRGYQRDAAVESLLRISLGVLFE